MTSSDRSKSVHVKAHNEINLIGFRYLILLVFLGLPGLAQAQLDMPSTLYTSGSSLSFNIKWNCSANECSLLEQDGSGWTTIRTSSSSSSGAGITRSLGSHTFRLKSCTTGSYGYVYCYDAPPQTITIKALPSTPSINAPANHDTGNYAVQVNTAAEATSYKVWKQTNGGSWSGPTTFNSSSGPSFNESKSNGIYGYKAQACNAGGCSSDSVVKSVQVSIAPGVPESITVPSINDGSYTVSWGISTGDVTNYVLERRLGSGSYTEIYSNTGRSKSESVSAGNYTYRVKACHTTGTYTNCSGYRTSGSASAQVPSSAPAITLSSTNTTGSYAVSWNSVSNASTYTLQQKIGSGSWTTAQSSSATSKSFSVDSNSYSYRVQACNRLGCSSFSSVKTIDVALPPPLPTISVPSSVTDGIYTVTWGSVSGASRYELQRRLGSGSWNGVYSGTGTSKSESGLGKGSYTYQVRACRVVGAATGCSGWRASSAVVVSEPTSTPSVTLSATSGNGSYTVNWSSVGNTTSYVLEENPNSGTWSSQSLSPVSSTSKSYSGKGNGTYIYRVKACNAVGCSAYSGTKTIDVSLAPGVPSSITVPEAADIRAIDISWGAASGSVTTYKLERNGSQIYSALTPRSFEDAVSNAGSYTYRVKACHTTRSFENCSGWRTSGQVVVVIKPSMPLLGFTALPGSGGGVELEWSDVAAQIPEPVSYFILEYQIDGDTWVSPYAYKGTATSFNLPSIGSGTYKFSLRACVSVSASGENFELCSDRNLEPPPVAKPAGAPSWSAGLATTNVNGSYQLSWSHLTDTSWYVLQQKIGGNWIEVISTSSESYQFNNKPSGRYTYRLLACNGFGCSAEVSSEFTIDVARQPDVPVWSSTTTLSDGGYTIAWSNVYDNVTHYKLQESANNGSSWTETLNGTGLSKAFSGRGAGTYLYRVAAFNTVGGATNNSGWSSSYTMTVAPPAVPGNVHATNQVENNYTIAWNSVVNTREYEVAETVDGVTNTWRSTSTSVNLLDKAENTYAYRIKACNNIGCSASSAPVSVQVVITPGQPGTFTATAAPATRKTALSWGAASGSPSYYQVQQRLGSGAWNSSQSFTGTSGSWPTAVTAAGTYQYQIRACRTMGTRTGCSAWVASNTVNYTVPGTPTLQVPESSSDGSYAVSWNGVSYADHYVLEENGTAQTLTGTAKTFGAASAKAGGRYTYQVKACNALGCGALSAAKTVNVRASSDDNDATNGANEGANVVSPPPADLPAGTPVGSIGGEFGVNEAGAATYSIPLLLPEGTAGVTPQLSFNYSSQGGNGVMGQGWSLGGISGITRCRQTLAQDGQAKPISWSREDRFCLNGQRLMLDSGTAYGEVGAMYKTELDSFVSVVSHGGSAGHPDYFTVTAKDGSTSTYGRTADSRLKAGTSTLTWAMSRFEDNMQNRIDFYYTGDAASGQRIDYIDYAYPATASSSSPGASVTFIYEDRPDSASSWVAGFEFHQSKRLSKVVVKNASSGTPREYRTYDLKYQNPLIISSDNISRLASVQECVATRCLEKTSFTWPEPSTPIIKANTLKSQLPIGDLMLVVDYKNPDINGDGILDLVWVRYRQGNPNYQDISFSLARADGGYSTLRTVGTFNSNLANVGSGIEIHVIDYNGDGRQDVITRQKDAPADSAWRLFLAVAGGPDWGLQEATDIDLPFPNVNVQFGDINSDGMADAYYTTNNRFRVHYLRSTGTGLTSDRLHYRYDDTPQSSGFLGLTTSLSDDYWKIEGFAPGGVGDFNGDGRVDLIVEAQYYTIEWHTNATEPGPVGHGVKRMAFAFGDEGMNLFGEVGPGIANGPALPLRMLDANADGLTDVVFHKNDTWQMSLSTGQAWTAPVAIPGFPDVEDKNVLVADVNRDSYPDLIHVGGGGSLQVHAWLPEAGEFSSSSWEFSRSVDVSADDRYAVLDIDGDGWTDVLRFETANSQWSSNTIWSAILSDRKGETSPNLITAITDGLGNETTINYELLTDSDHYSRVDVGEVITRRLSEVCAPDPRDPQFAPPICYTPVKYTINTDEFYRTLNDPFATLPEGNDHLAEVASPVLEVYAPLPVVTNVASTAPVAGNPNAKSEVSYYYDQLKFQAAGRGSLGFRRLITFDHQTGTRTETTYRQDWPFIGSPLETTVTTAGGHTLSQSTSTWGLKTFTGPDGRQRYQTYISEAVEQSYALADNGASAGELLSTTTTASVYDDYGNPENVTTVTEGGGETLTKAVENTYGDEWHKQFGRLSTSTVTTTKANSSGTQTLERHSKFTYIPSGAKRGLLWTETVEPDTALAITTTYTYDDYGNRTKAVKQAADGTTRQSDTTVYEDGRYVKTVTNALGHLTQEVISRNRFGSPTLIRDIHRMATTIRYDELGREYLRQDDTGAWSWRGSVYCDTSINCPNGAVYRVEQRVAGGGKGYTYHDSLGREVRTTAIGFDGTPAQVDTEYDNLGRVKRISTPYAFFGPVNWTESTYDILGRVTEITLPNGAFGGRTGYDGYDTIITNALGHTKTETRDVSGNLIQVTDNLGGTIRYDYDLSGNLLSATTDALDASPVTVRMCYDMLGRKIGMHDPDKGGFLGNANATCETVARTPNLAGWWHYTYNGVGELIGQRDTKGQTQSMTYDALGRMLTRTDRHANGSVEGHTRWYYDADMNGASSLDGDLGNVTYVVQSSGSINESCSGNTHCTANVYDAFGRATDTITFLPGASEAYITGVRYDSIGRPYRSIDALEGLVHSVSGTRQHYNAYGYKSQITDIASGDVLYKINATNARGQVVEEERGNGVITTYEYDPYFGRTLHQEAGLASWLPIQDITYEWDILGNLKSRHNRSVNEGNTAQKDLRESFCYDGLNRLIKSHQGTLTGGCGISASQQDVEYNGLGNITRKAGVGSYSYGNNAGPHAVTQAGGIAYTYDNNGNMTGGDGRTLQYSTFDKATRISKGGNVTEFSYGPDRGRYKRVDANAEMGTGTTTTYIGNIERIQKQGENTITWRRTVAGAVYTLKTDLNYTVQGSTNKAFIYKDHLGSTDVITDAVGTVIESHSFDPWGQRRNSENWSNLTSAQLLNFTSNHTKRGYTGHEQMDEMGLVHMNGRIYDAKLGRFLQADPFIQAASNTQSYNRYSYVMNNPLNATDPSGFFLKKLWDEIRPFVGAIVGIVLAYFCQACGYAAYAAIGGVSGAVGAAANGGNILQGMALGALSGFAYSVAGWAGGAIAGGFSAAVTGGDVASAFASGVIGGLAGGGEGMSGLIIASIAGGVTSEITGGKFKNGASSAAFMWAIQAGLRGGTEPTEPKTSESGEKYGGKEAFDKAAEALSTKEGLSEVAGTKENHTYKDKHYVSKNIKGRNVYKELGGAEIDGDVDGALKTFNKKNGGGWSTTLGSCSKGRVCTVYRGATASSSAYGMLSRTSGYPTNFTKNSVESVLATMAHEYIHYSTGENHAAVKTRLSERSFGRAEENAVNIYRGN